MPKPNSHDDYVVRRGTALVQAKLRQVDLRERWGCSPSMVNELVTGRCRSREKELDFAELVGKSHAYLFAPTDDVRTRQKA